MCTMRVLNSLYQEFQSTYRHGVVYLNRRAETKINYFDFRKDELSQIWTCDWMLPTDDRDIKNIFALVFYDDQSWDAMGSLNVWPINQDGPVKINSWIDGVISKL
jgi:hypothetical protein